MKSDKEQRSCESHKFQNMGEWGPLSWFWLLLLWNVELPWAARISATVSGEEAPTGQEQKAVTLYLLPSGSLMFFHRKHSL